ncbi:MAG: CBS domain-containing protein [Planctomycetia bacterium]|jgi:CBS domain-containing protein
METVMDILRFKGFRPPVATSPAASVLEATRLMNDERIGSILVMHAGRLVGMFTERDVLRRVVAEMRRPEQTLVGEVMTEEVLCCDPETPIDEVAEVMRRQRVRHLPVVDGDGLVVGLVSIGDVNAQRFNSCEIALHQVEDYIHRRA